MRISDWSSDVCSSDLNELHYSLGLPIVGTWLMGLVSLLYGLALLSGVVIHLPRLLQNLFALRPGRNLKQFWQDAHNVVGVLSLPMHVMFAITGALLCLLLVLLTTLNPLVYEGKLMAARSEERRVGKEWVSTCRSGGA